MHTDSIRVIVFVLSCCCCCVCVVVVVFLFLFFSPFFFLGGGGVVCFCFKSGTLSWKVRSSNTHLSDHLSHFISSG